MKKKLILLSIILFPSLIYLFFEMTKANFKKMAYYGPKMVKGKGDTVYYSVPHISFGKNLTVRTDTTMEKTGETVVTKVWKSDSAVIDTSKFPVYLILFLDPQLKKEGYKLEGLFDYIKYKAKDLIDIPIFIISDLEGAYGGENISENIELRGDFDSIKVHPQGFYPLLGSLKTDRELYFKQKPIHVFNYFAILVDKQRHIRGYYDPTFNAEIKRMIADYKHLKIRDGYAQTQQQNEIKQNDTK